MRRKDFAKEGKVKSPAGAGLGIILIGFDILYQEQRKPRNQHR